MIHEDDVEKPTRFLDEDELYTRLKAWYQDDRDHHAEWAKLAKEDYDFVAGHQWTSDELEILNEQRRPASVFNRVSPVIDSVSGFEVANRQETRYLPRKLGNTGVNEMLTAAGAWFRDQTDAEDEESDSFRDAAICGVGATETRIEYETNPDGDPDISRVDPLEVFPDRNARKPNYVDAKRVWRIRKMSRDDAAALFPNADIDVLNAGWADAEDLGEPVHVNRADRYDDDDDVDHNGRIDTTIVECQWWEREPFVRFVDGATGQEQVLPQDQFDMLLTRMEKLGPEGMYMMGVAPPIGAVTQYRRVYRRAFLGKALLEEPQSTAVDGHFSYKFITGKRDHNKGHFYGLVRSMKDPQRWTNKLFSQIMHILNSNAKGGILAELGAFEDDREAAKNWAKADGVTYTTPGALQSGKIQPKPQTPFPAGQAEMLQFAMGAMPLVTGVNMEFLGMKDAQQAGVLEFQRRQAGVTILATLFDSLRRYRKDQGRLMLLMIQKYLSDGRLVKIVEKDQIQYLPLDRSATLGEYDVIVDEAPASPNAKDRNWQIIQQMMPLLAPAMTPQIAAALLQYSPLPETAMQELTKAMTAGPPPEQQALKKIMDQFMVADAAAEVDKKASSAEKNRADALARQAATIQSTLPIAQALVSPDLPPAPVPTGPIPGVTGGPGAFSPPPLMPMAPPRPPAPPSMPTMPDMAGRTNMAPPPGLLNMPRLPGG